MTVRIEKRPGAEREDRTPEKIQSLSSGAIGTVTGVVKDTLCRSEERRVGKECRSRWSPYH